MARNLRAAAAAVEAAAGAKGWNVRDLAAAAGVDYGTAADLVGAKRWPRNTTRAAIEKALDWPAGSIKGIAEGGAVPGASSSAQPRGLVLPPESERLSPRQREAVLAVVRAMLDPHEIHGPDLAATDGWVIDEAAAESSEPSHPRPRR